MIQLSKWLVVIRLLLDIAFLVLHHHPRKYHCMEYIMFVTINSGRGCSFVTIYSSVSYIPVINSHDEANIGAHQTNQLWKSLN